jgi:hypothetical protein
LYQNERASTVRIEHRQISIQQTPGGIKRITTIEDGTVFFVSRAGQVITDLHVVNDDLPNSQSTRMVRTADGATYEAKVIDKNTGHDLDLLDLTAPPQAQDIHPVQFAESSQFSSPVHLSATEHPLGWQKTFLSPGAYLGSTLAFMMSRSYISRWLAYFLRLILRESKRGKQYGSAKTRRKSSYRPGN